MKLHVRNRGPWSDERAVNSWSVRVSGRTGKYRYLNFQKQVPLDSPEHWIFEHVNGTFAVGSKPADRANVQCASYKAAREECRKRLLAWDAARRLR